MRKLASIVKVSEIIPIKDADRIEIARMEGKGWQCVVRKGEFQVGDLGVYFEIDSLLPRISQFSFLPDSTYKKLPNGDEGYLLKTIKLRKTLSQGLLLPLSEFVLDDYNIGDDVSEEIGVKKYDPPLPVQLAGNAIGRFPSCISKTDQERVQNIPEVVTNFNVGDWEVTEKLDGTSCTFAIVDDQFVVCSRNINLKEDESNTLWQMAYKYDIEETLRQHGLETIALQGEVCGPGIQENPLNLNECQFFLFDIFNMSRQRYLTPQERCSIMRVCQNISHVPIIDSYFDNRVVDSVDDLINATDGIQSMLCQGMAEGLVFKNHRVDVDITSFKVINNSYLLK